MQKNILEKTKELELKLPLEIELNGIQIKNKERQNWGYTTFEHIAGNRDDSFVCDKPIVFIGAKNRGFTKNINPDNIKILGSSNDRFVESIKRTMSYINGDGLEHEEIANWFVSRLIVNPNFVIANQNKTNEVIAVLKLIEKLEPSLKLVIPNENGGNSLSMLYHDGQLLLNNIPLNKLSTGFVSIVKIFQEIIAGYGGWSNLDNLSMLDGIVFIDEIEAHLHISWQTKIINILKDFFLNTTFYISTHSPLVLAGLRDGEAYELYEDIREEKVIVTNNEGKEEEQTISKRFVKTKAIQNVDNYALNDIVNEFFRVDLNKEKIVNSDKNKQNKAKKKLLDLVKTLQEEEK
jgi:hypothetical protein